MITKNGIAQMVDFIRDGNGTPPSNIGVGIGTTAPLPENTALVNEVYPTTSRNPTSSSKSSNVVTFYMQQATAEGSTANYSEHGLFTNSTTGTMWTRQTFPDFEKSSDIVMEHYINIEVGSYLP